MSSLLVAPAVAAKQWLNRLGPLSAVAAILGAVAGFLGTMSGHWLSTDHHPVPTGPMIVLCASTIVAISMLSITIVGVLRRASQTTKALA
jgi:manganese/zinc/iron transport system permease protein